MPAGWEPSGAAAARTAGAGVVAEAVRGAGAVLREAAAPKRGFAYLCAGSLLAAPWKRTRYCPYPSSLSRSTGMNRSAAELMQ